MMNKEKKICFSSDFHGNTEMLREFLRRATTDDDDDDDDGLNADYVIIGGDIGPRGGKFHGHELVEFNSKDVVKRVLSFSRGVLRCEE
jgi:Icc-related predicted phosphoesterase